MSMNDQLSYAFHMADWRIERANNHITHVKQIIEWIVHPDQYTAFPYRDPNSGHYGLSVGPKHGALPRHLPIVMGEAIHNLSIALDYLWNGVVRVVSPDLKGREHFPRHKCRRELVDKVSKTPVVQKLPGAKDFIVDHIRPYKDGNLLLWTIGKLDNIDKHRLLISCLTIAKFGKFVATGEDGSIIDLSHSTLNTHGPSLTLGFASPFKLNDDAEITVNVAFDEPEDIAPGQPVLETLVNFSQTTKEVVEAFRGFFLK